MERLPEPEVVISGLPLEMPEVGIGVYASRLVRGLLAAPERPAFRVLVTPAAAEAAPWLPRENAEIVRAPLRTGPAFLRWIGCVFAVARAAAKRFPGAVFHAPEYHWSPVAPRRTIVSMHDATTRRYPIYLGKRGVRRAWLAACERFGRTVARRVLTLSEHSRRDLVEIVGVPEEKIRVLHAWVDNRYLAPIAPERLEAVRAAHGLPRRFWLYLGGYDVRKNVGLLVKAYARAARTGISVPTLVLAGRLPAPDAPAALVHPLAGLPAGGLDAGQILTPGRIPDGDLPALFRAAELVVYPSLFEGFGLPPAEAMAVGTPVLVADTSSLPEVVPRKECRFDPLDDHALAARLLEAAGNPTSFSCPLREEFTEAYAITRYLSLLREVGAG